MRVPVEMTRRIAVDAVRSVFEGVEDTIDGFRIPFEGGDVCVAVTWEPSGDDDGE